MSPRQLPRVKDTLDYIAKRIYTALPDASVRSALSVFGVQVSETLAQEVREYISILLLWNQRLNLTALTDPREILDRHFGESMFAAAAVPIQDGRLADVGSGAGFPGLALKLVRRELQVSLIEPNEKKVAFLAEVKRRLTMSGVEILRGRFEDIRFLPKSADLVTARAVGEFRHLLLWSARVLSPSGMVVLWLGAADAEQVSRTAGWHWRKPMAIPRSQRRVLLVGQPLS